MSVLRKVARRLGRRPRFEYRLVMCRDLDGTVPRFSTRAPFEVEGPHADAAYLEQVLAIAAIPVEYRNDVPRRIAAGDLCWVA
jgi:hypothetical protein